MAKRTLRHSHRHLIPLDLSITRERVDHFPRRLVGWVVACSVEADNQVLDRFRDGPSWPLDLCLSHRVWLVLLKLHES